MIFKTIFNVRKLRRILLTKTTFSLIPSVLGIIYLIKGLNSNDNFLYLISILLFICSIFLFIAQKKSELYLLFFSLLTCTYMIEFFMSSSFLKPKSDINRAALAEKLGIKRDNRTLEQIINDPKQNNQVFSSGLFGVAEIDFQGKTYSVFQNVPNSLVMGIAEVDLAIKYITDRYGFNNPDKVWECDKKIFFLGDSFTEGHGPEMKYSFVNRLRTDRECIVNLGLAGSGSLRTLASWREFGESDKSEAVIWVYFENDLTESLLEKDRIYGNYLNKKYNQNLKAVMPSISDELRYEQKKRFKKFIEREEKKNYKNLNKSNFDFLVDRVLMRNIKNFLFKKYQVIKTHNKIISNNAVSILESALDEIPKDIPKLFVYLPHLGSLDGRPPIENKYKKEVIEAAKRIGFDVIDISDEMSNNPRKFYSLKVGPHFNKKGNKVVAEKIRTWSGW